MKFIIKTIGGLLLIMIVTGGYLFAFGTVDLRTEESKTNPKEKNANLLLQEMAEAHGAKNWDDFETYTVQFEDRFFGDLGSFSNPFYEDTVQFNLTYIPNSFDGQMEFLTGDGKGIVWGMQSWKTYVKDFGEKIKFNKNESIKFWLPNYQYFIEFPNRILNADKFAMAGEKVIDDKNCIGIVLVDSDTCYFVVQDGMQIESWIDGPPKYLGGASGKIVGVQNGTLSNAQCFRKSVTTYANKLTFMMETSRHAIHW